MPPEADTSCDSLDLSGYPPAFARFDLEGQDVFDNYNGIALDYAFAYKARVLDGRSSEYRLELTLCHKLGTAPQVCSASLIDLRQNCTVGSLRWGIDPSGLVYGDNEYTFDLSLYHGTDTVSTSRIEKLYRWPAP